jgi:hypothetical protein
MRSYEAARSLFSFLAFVAWSVVVIGVLVALIGMGSVSQYAGGGAGLLATVPGIGIAITGFILVAFVQMGRATVDTAEYTQQMLKIARDQLEVSRQGLKAHQEGPTSFAGQAAASAVADQRSFAERIPAERTQNDVPRTDGPYIPSFLQTDQSRDHALENWDYRDTRINKTEHGYLVEGETFESLELAKLHVDGEALRRELNAPNGPGS